MTDATIAAPTVAATPVKSALADIWKQFRAHKGGVAGLFMETHPRPAEAWSDGPNAVPLKHMKALLETLVALDSVTKKTPLLEDNFQ